MIIFDNHFHLDFNGLCLKAVNDFELAGGTHFMLVHKGFTDYETTLKIAETVRKETNVKVFVALGPHPAELSRLLEKLSLKKVVEVMKKRMEKAGKYVTEKKSVAIGEIGRPHYPVPENVWDASNEIMEYGMSIASDVGCPVILHTEDATRKTFKEIAEMADKANLKREKVIKHYSPPFVRPEDNFGIFPSILVKKDVVKEAIKISNRFMMETDYMDDIKRPGAVLGPKTVPKVTKLFFEKSIFTENDIIKIHKENPERVYQIKMD